MPLFNQIPTIAVDVGAYNLAGFQDRTSSTMAFNSGTRTLTISPVTSFNVWTNNTLWTKAVNQTVVIANTVGQHFCYFDSTGTLVESTTPWDVSSDQVAPAALIYWDGTNGAMADERHGAYRNRILHSYLHNTRGCAYDSGFDGTFTNTTLSVTTGIVWDEDIKAQSAGTVTTARVWRRASGGTTMTFQDLTTPYIASAGTLQWDNNGTLTNVTGTGGGNYITNWTYATTDYNVPFYVVVSQAQYTTLTAARAANAPTFPNLTTREWKLAYQLIYRQVGANATYVEANDYRSTSNLPNTGTTTSIPASAVTFVPITGITSTNVQNAFAEVAPLTSGIADGATAVGVTFNTAATYSTAGAKLLSLQNNGIEKAFIDKDGVFSVPAGSSITLKGAPTDNAAGIGVILDSGTAMTASGSKVLSIRDGGVEAAFLGRNQNFYVNASIGTIDYYGDSLGTGTIKLNGSAADGATAVACAIDNAFTTLTTTGAKLVSIRNNGTEKAFVDKDGVANFNTSLNVGGVGSYQINAYKAGSTCYIAAMSDAGQATGYVWGNGVSTTGWVAYRYPGTNDLIWFEGGTVNLDRFYMVAGGKFGVGIYPTSGVHLRSVTADGATAVASILDTTAAYTTAGAKLLSIQNGGTEKAFFDLDGYIGFPDGQAIKWSPGGSVGRLTVMSSRAADDVSGDFIVDTLNTRTAGSGLLSVRNAGSNRFDITFDGVAKTSSGIYTVSDTATPVTILGHTQDNNTPVAVVIDNDNTLTVAGAKLLSVRNNTVEHYWMNPNGAFTYTVGTHVMSTDSTVTGGSNGHLRIIDTNYAQKPYVEVSNFNIKFGDAINGYSEIDATTGSYYTDWDSATTYTIGQRVNWNGGYVYTSLQNSNLNHTPPLGGDTWWAESTAGNGLRFYSLMAADESNTADFSFQTRTRTAGAIFDVWSQNGIFSIAYNGIITIPSAMTFGGSLGPQSGINTLDRYTEYDTAGAYKQTPVIKFGGGTTGITYSTQVAGLTIIGDTVTWILSIVLTSKGSSTGTVTIESVTTVAPLVDTPCTIYASNLSFTSGSHVQAYLGTDSKIHLSQIASTGTVTNLDNTNFSNTTTLKLSCSYQISST